MIQVHFIRKPKVLLATLLTILVGPTNAQSPVEAYTLVNIPSKPFDYKTEGFKTGTAYSPTEVYTHYFGNNGTDAGFNREIQSVKVNGREFFKSLNSAGLPFDKVNHQKHPKLAGNIINTLFEVASSKALSLYFLPDYVGTLDEVINSFYVNRGSDNTFSNNAGTSSNIERIDLLSIEGVIAQDIERQGFLINERNGNDNIKVAAILDISEGGAPTKYGTLLPIEVKNWGKTGPSIVTRVMSRDTLKDQYLKPNVDIGSQTISGVFFNLKDLGIAQKTIFYGFSIFPFDVDESMDLIGLSDVPTDTDGTINGGADLLAGSGYFSDKPLVISGSVIDDSGARNDDQLSGNKLGRLDKNPIYIHLVDENLGIVINSQIVNKEGNYEFPAVLSKINYSLYLSIKKTNNNGNPGEVQLPKEWMISGENVNSISSKGYDKNPDGKISISLDETGIVQVDFGVSKESY